MPRLSGQITLAAVGKMRQKQWLLAQEAYQKRLSRYTKFTLREVKDVVGKGVPDSVAVQREGDQLLKAAKAANYVIVLTPVGEQMSSPQLARFLQKQVERHHHLALLIGGPVGFADGVIEAAHKQLSLSRLTFPHELARVMLLEQLYRACTILNNEKYHK